MRIEDRYPGVADLKRRAKARMPHFAWEYLDSGTGRDDAVRRNEAALQAVRMWPGVMAGKLVPGLATEIFGQPCSAPFGVAPVGLTSLMWPGAERALARAAREFGIPFCLSTMATDDPETVGRETGGTGWFQLYMPGRSEIRDDLLARARASGWKVLVLTVDVPTGSTRERQRKAGIAMPPARDLLTLWRIATRPAWAWETLQRGAPRFATIEPYIGRGRITDAARFIGREFDGALDWDSVAALRDLWQGPLVLKGLMRPGDAERAVALGIDGIGVSNHGGRQLDATPAAIEALPAIKAAVGGRARIIFDSGLRSGLDIARALALGADFCLLGRAFLYGVGALGPAGAGHTMRMLAEDLANNMVQMGVSRLADLPGALVRE